VATDIPDPPRRRLSLFDATSIMVGIIIGSSIYKLAPAIAASVPSPTALMFAWAAGGLFALCGALCYAELACAMPEDGGEYNYLGRAYGGRVAFLYAWAVMWVIRPGTIGSIAFVFGEHFKELFTFVGGTLDSVGFAVAIVVLLTAVNMLGIRPGTRTQNVLSVAKLLGLLAIVLVAFIDPAYWDLEAAAEFSLDPYEARIPSPPPPTDWRLAMIFVLYAFGGWSDMPMVAAEVREPERNLFRGLVYGALVVTAIYLLVNLACLYSLGFDRFQQTDLIAVELVRPLLGETGEKLVAVLVCITAAGALNAMIFTGARVSFALGKDHGWFGWLANWSDRYGGPLVALAAQCAISVALIRGFGQRGDGFDRMLNYTSPVFFAFFLLTGMALWILRRREPNLPRPYRTTGYPVTWLVFCLSSAFMLYSSVSYAVEQFGKSEGLPEAAWAGGVMLAGLVIAILARGKAPSSSGER
jgi:APA family basic amino acid/polyamine antiporter